jgi:aminoglycoside 3-N-acetyltransferase I
MSSSAPFSIRQLTPEDVVLMEAMLTTFGEAFDEVETYSGARPSRAYLARLLGSECFTSRLPR